MPPANIVALAAIYLVNLFLLTLAASEHLTNLEVSEGVPVGTKIGFIDDGAVDSVPPFLIVPVGAAVDTDLSIDQKTGEITTKVPLDRETRASYSLVAIPANGVNIKVVVKVLDENDNAPTFPSDLVNIEFPENTPKDVKRTLPPARDLDLDVYNTQKYNIISGNVNSTFRLSSHRERDGVLYLDLQINGYLDRETCEHYSLLIEALDGGTPPLKGEMTVNITIQDVNDNPPIFNQSRYFASVQENSTIGTSVLQVLATDNDVGDNAQIEYSINRRQSDKDMLFRIDASTGVIAVNKPLDFETKELHELVIVARDHGLQPLEATTFVSIKVIDVNDNQPTINVIFLSDDTTPKISESAQPGEFVARISVHDPDSKTEYSNVNVTLQGGNGHFDLTTRDNIIYLVIDSLPLDREQQPNYTLNIIATDTGTPPLHASRSINLLVTDVNDNTPEFEQDVYEANVMEVSDPGTSVIQVFATDKDEGNNSLITYSLLKPANSNINWFQIDARSGLITTRARVDCETEPLPQLTVIATDNGFPPLSSTARVLVTIHDVNDNEPIFDQSFYNVSVAESEAEGRCILKVSATDPDCGVNAVVNYTLGDGFEKLREFKVRSDSGEICINSTLDYESRNAFEFPVIATDRGGLSTTAMVKIQLTDVNDNRPVFYPPEYNVSLRDGGTSSSATAPVVVVSATDADSGKFGTVTYNIVAGNEAGLFRIDRSTGEIFVNRPHQLSTRSQPYHRLNISATDGGNLKSLKDAEVFISIIDSTQRPPIFDLSRYMFSVMENVKKEFVVGHVKATVVSNGRSNVRYSIYSGDPDGLFRIDPITGAIKVSGNLDHESRASVLLNVQATSGNPPVYGHTQVNIDITDVNDNHPEFESPTVRISIPENAEIGVPLYAAHATDKDSGSNGVVRYKLVNTGLDLFKIDPKLGHLTLTRHLDYESVQRHTLMVTATDMGVPQLSSNLTILVEVQDMNDNPPVFEKSQYSLTVLESLPINTQITQFTAVDADTGNNARITYRLVSSNRSNGVNDYIFGIFPNSGWLYLNGTLDRETKDRYNLVVSAKDNGLPPQTATSQVTIEVLDINDNDPVFSQEDYHFKIEENLARGTFVGKLHATDIDFGVNAAIRYSLIPSNSSFEINSITGDITTKEILNRESREYYDLVAEARDQGQPSRSSRVAVKISVLDVNDNAPVIVDPQEDVVSVREEQSPGTEVVRIRATDADNGYNSSISYSLLKDSDGLDTFSIHPITGVIRTKVVLDHEEKTMYRIGVVASDGGSPSKQSVRMLRIEVLDLNDNRPTFTSSSLAFTVREDAKIGQIVGSAASLSPEDEDNIVPDSTGNHITYTLTTASDSPKQNPFEIERSTGKIVVAQELDRETQSEYKLEIKALDIRTLNNPQSSAITVKIEVTDANDNIPKFPQDPVILTVSEDTTVGSSIYNFTAIDLDSAENGEVRYAMASQYPSNAFMIDSLTGTLTLTAALDYEIAKEHFLVVKAHDQPLNSSEKLTGFVTVKILVSDFNDNTPRFILPQNSIAFLSDNAVVGMKVTTVLAVDDDGGDNGRVTYILSNTNDASYYSLGYDTGILTLAKPPVPNRKSYTLNITATDHGKPTRQEVMKLKVLVQDSSNTFQKLLEAEYEASVMENAGVGTLVTQIGFRGVHESGGNASFFIPSGMADDTFEVHASSGKVFTRKALNRESTESYLLPIYVTDFGSNEAPVLDKTRLLVRVIDINDHPPKFQPGSCQRLSVPENSDTAVFHTVVASDPDKGLNGDITYSITSGNIRNKFSIDSKTGALKAKPLDRESNARYYLTITAQDHGTPPMQGSCNLTVFVEDQNDNDPKFDLSKYSTSVLEDVPIDTSIMKVHASDADIGLNAKIIYFLANESQWLFRIDNKTGVITTAGLFDRERQSEYNFMVVATDSGKYNARSTKVPVTVIVKDVNDNKPIFTKYPFQEKVPSYIQPGQNILKVSAKDIDEGTNAEIVYSLTNDNLGKFRIHPTTGVLSATQSLSTNSGKIIYLNVIATDKGNPPKSSTGLIELIVGDLPDSSLSLHFQNSTYDVTIQENTDQFHDVAQVSAVRTDGRRQKILYSFGMGNEENIFVIGAESGVIQVRDSKNLDYEKHHTINLVVEAKTDGNPNLHGYCDVVVRLNDENDNAPKFTQQQYTASVWEGDKKGTFVLRAIASDADQGSNSKILYHIVDGNHDNAFKIEPPFSGIVETNTVLDREIRDNYRLTIIATDEGIPQMTGTARVHINVVDVNDNQPTFPPPRTIKVTEVAQVGSLLTTLTANDVDTFPELTYSFASSTDLEYSSYFSIDRYSGKIFLKKQLDFERWQECGLKIVVSDTAHVAETVLTVEVEDVNDNQPVFTQSTYEANLPDTSTALMEVLTVNATDADSGNNSKITFSIVNPTAGFSIGAVDGIIKVNVSNMSASLQDVFLTIRAEDSGEPPRHSLAVVRIKNSKRMESSYGYKKEYKITVPEDIKIGSYLLHLAKPSTQTSSFSIIEGNIDKMFQISNPSGALTLVKNLDRELQDEYDLTVSIDENSFLVTHVIISVEDCNDNTPVFGEEEYEKSLSETLPSGSSVEKVTALDADLPGSVNSEVFYEITSGNVDQCFRIDSKSGIIYVNNTLDYDKGATDYLLIVKACDKGPTPLCSLASVKLHLQDENDNVPLFPFTEYLESVGENEPVGTAVFTAHATDMDKGIYGNVNYTIIDSHNYAGLENSWKLFHIDSQTGLVTTATMFDYEQRSRYNFGIRATDSGGRSTTVKVYIEIESKDEYYPQFTERNYRFSLATSVPLPVGYVVGRVLATDKDKGPDGRVVYQLAAQHSYFKVNRTTGALLLKKKFDQSETAPAEREIKLEVTASSGRQGSLLNSTTIDVVLDPLADPSTNLVGWGEGNTYQAPQTGVSDWILGLVISVVLLVLLFGAAFAYLHVKNKRNKKMNKPNLNSETVSQGNNYVDPSAFDTIPIRGGAPQMPPQNQFAPPKYDEIPPYGGAHAASSNSGAATTSELSGSEQSGSSGRGSAEDGDDGEDEEIRMINEGPMQRSNDTDSLSAVSVRNTQEYLARLGIVDNSALQRSEPKEQMHHHQTVPLDSLHTMFEEEAANENDITNLIYAKLNDVAGSDRASSADEGATNTLGPTMEHVMAISYGEVPTVTHQPSMNGSLSSIVHSEEELAGSYNWDYLLDWGPQYQPLAHVFSEIARLKDDTASVHSGASGTSSVRSKVSVAPAKNIPPPLITSVAPRAIAMPILNSRGGHNQMMMLPRSPISHDASGTGFSTSTAMSPSFSPSLSPLATKSPSISPLVAPGLSAAHHAMSRQAQNRNKSVVDTELRI